MSKTQKNGPHLEKWASRGKLGHTKKNASHSKCRFHFQERVTLGKMCHPWGHTSQKWVIFGKMCHT